jgi:hypothetical protein
MRFALLTGSIVTLGALAYQQPPVRTLTLDVSIGGPDETRDEYSFAVISGLAFDRTGRMLVTDLKDNVVRVFDSTGKYVFRFGQPGQGPGDFSGAMSGVFSADGLFWVRDEGSQRWSAFEVGADRALPRLNVRYDHDRAYDRLNPVGFDAAGNLVSSGTVRDEKSMGRTRVPLRVTLDRSAKVLRSDTIFMPKGDSLGDFTITKPGKSGAIVTWFYFQPYGSAFVVAHAPNGEYARAVSSRYDVEWRSVDNRVLRHLRRDVVGPPLSAREKKVGQEQIDGFLQRSGMGAAELPYGLPDKKAPIRAMAFDQLGRLWVERSVPDGEAREADLYDATGKWIAIVKWPVGITPMRYGIIAARGDRVLAVRTDTASDVDYVVRLRMK